ncbi:DUF6710 family protein [Pseudalkalibacillus sp. A8]|uniref:DUF6710 family protein n=1 Tax=Pseudalkalibacillus sp. A8 TaxID=3382641 RepID=UPI0038B57ABD
MFKKLMVKMVGRDLEMERRKRFQHILNFAESVIQKGEVNFKSKHPIIDVICLLGRKTQSEMISDLLQCNETLTSAPPLERLLFSHTVPITPDGRKLNDFKKKVNLERTIKLKRDLILPLPWQRSRLVQSLTKIGFDRDWGPWTQDDLNHKVEVWMPMGIVWVHGGSHSIASGIIRGEGVINTSNVDDISEIYDHVSCDGLNFYRTEDNSVIAPVQNLEFAAIFEIGRMMNDKKITF